MLVEADKRFIGMTVEEADSVAENMNPQVFIRVIKRNGMPLICTRDYNTSRVNVILEEGIIIDYDDRG